MTAIRPWCQVTIVGQAGIVLADRALVGSAAPDLDAVDELAWMALIAGRIGGGITLDRVSPELRELLELCGLGVEVERKAEGREESLGVEEGEKIVHPGDLPG
jgi:hypothetical protein